MALVGDGVSGGQHQKAQLKVYCLVPGLCGGEGEGGGKVGHELVPADGLVEHPGRLGDGDEVLPVVALTPSAPVLLV